MRTLKDFQPREAELREVTRKWIEARDKRYREVEATHIAQANKPIRHPKGRSFDRNSREFLWNDFFWCQDGGSEPFQEFFEVEDEELSEMADCQGCEDGDPDDESTEYGKVWAWFTNIFNEEFVKVCPDLKHVLDG